MLFPEDFFLCPTRIITRNLLLQLKVLINIEPIGVTGYFYLDTGTKKS